MTAPATPPGSLLALRRGERWATACIASFAAAPFVAFASLIYLTVGAWTQAISAAILSFALFMACIVSDVIARHYGV